jgi:hypothetical protein
MKIIVDRFSETDTDELGKVSVDGVFVCYSIENPDRPEKIKGITAIPEGTYKVGRRISPHFGVMVPWIMNVPNFQYVLIHWGNTVKDTEGCLVVGLRIGSLENQRAVLDSKQAWEKLSAMIFDALDNNEEVTIEYMKK